jgi:hypothetical protein
VNRPARATALAGLAALLGLALWSDFPLCPMAGTFGVPCPGCGLTRATLALLRGDIHAALHFHPLVWLLAPLFIGFMLAATLELVRGPSQKRRVLVNWNRRSVSVIALFVLASSLTVWIARFAGHFGGPVPVTTMSQWLATRWR